MLPISIGYQTAPISTSPPPPPTYPSLPHEFCLESQATATKKKERKKKDTEECPQNSQIRFS